MAERLHGVLLAVSGEDADLLRAIDAHGSGLRVVRRCADTAELLSAAMAGLAALVVVDTEFDDLDLSVVDRLARAGATGIVLTSADQAERWAVAGWPVEERSIDPGAVRARLQVLAHAVENGPPAPTMRVAAPSQSDDGADDQLWAELAVIEPSAPAVPDDGGGADDSIPVEKAPSPAEPGRRPSDACDGGPPHGAGAQTSGTNGANGGIVVVWGPAAPTGGQRSRQRWLTAWLPQVARSSSTPTWRGRASPRSSDCRRTPPDWRPPHAWRGMAGWMRRPWASSWFPSESRSACCPAWGAPGAGVSFRPRPCPRCGVAAAAWPPGRSLMSVAGRSTTRSTSTPWSPAGRRGCRARAPCRRRPGGGRGGSRRSAPAAATAGGPGRRDAPGRPPRGGG